MVMVGGPSFLGARLAVSQPTPFPEAKSGDRFRFSPSSSRNATAYQVQRQRIGSPANEARDSIQYNT